VGGEAGFHHTWTGAKYNSRDIGTSVGPGPWEIKHNYFSGHRCLDEKVVIHGE